jgi:hypothetical protein
MQQNTREDELAKIVYTGTMCTITIYSWVAMNKSRNDLNTNHAHQLAKVAV